MVAGAASDILSDDTKLNAKISEIRDCYRNVEMIAPKSPADGAGLRQYDVLQKFNDQWLVNAQQLAVLVRMGKAGDSITLSLLRDGKPLSVAART